MPLKVMDLVEQRLDIDRVSHASVPAPGSLRSCQGTAANNGRAGFPAIDLACAYPMRWGCETVIGQP